MRMALAAFAAAAACACGSGDPPTITALGTPIPAEVVVGEAVQLTLGVGVLDEDGNLAELRVALTSPSARSVKRTIDVKAQAGTARNSTISLLLEVQPLEAGTFTIEVIAADENDNVSSPATVSFAALPSE